MPSIEIPDISIREIYIPDVPEIYTPHYITITEPPEIDAPGCTYQHRDIKNTGNRNLLLEDPNGVFTTCLLYTSPSPRDKRQSRMPSSA